MEISIHRIDWQQTISLRHRVLWPNEPPEFCHVEGDEEALHFGAFFDDQLVSVAAIYLNGNQARLRKFATLVRYQNKGIGSKVVSSILNTIKEHGVTYLWCDARESAMGLYQRFGLKEEGGRFYKAEIPYYKMSIDL